MTQCIALAVLVFGSDPATGVVRGRVVWAGDAPAVGPLPAAIPAPSGYRLGIKPNPFTPQLKDGGLGGAVLSLRRVPADRCKPWPYPPAAVEQADHELKVRQGDGPPRAVGFVRAGDPVTVVSRDPGPATVRLRGAAFVTLPFTGPDQPLTRRLDTPGMVEVTSGTMLAWAACDLIVSDHPYVALSDADGRFELTGVPPGDYTLACRVRSWRETGHDRDPETGLISRRRFAPPVELTAAVRVPDGGTVEQSFTVGLSTFEPAAKK